MVATFEEIEGNTSEWSTQLAGGMGKIQTLHTRVRQGSEGIVEEVDCFVLFFSSFVCLVQNQEEFFLYFGFTKKAW